MEKSFTDVFKSRRFISAVAMILVMLFVAWIPALEAYEQALIDATVAVGLALILGYTAQDVFAEISKSRAIRVAVDDRLDKWEDSAEATEDPADDLAVQVARAVVDAMIAAGVLWRPDIPTDPEPDPEQQESQSAFSSAV